jgi:hypothetical protein
VGGGLLYVRTEMMREMGRSRIRFRNWKRWTKENCKTRLMQCSLRQTESFPQRGGNSTEHNQEPWRTVRTHLWQNLFPRVYLMKLILQNLYTSHQRITFPNSSCIVSSLFTSIVTPCDKFNREPQFLRSGGQYTYVSSEQWKKQYTVRMGK